MAHTAGVRVRFAPSPTGSLHLGGLRTALFNILFARRHNGVAILRIEDTDRVRRNLNSFSFLTPFAQKRLVPEAEAGLIETLEWAGLNFDEGPHRPGGSFGPYRQSERLALYREHAARLVHLGAAYHCFCQRHAVGDSVSDTDSAMITHQSETHTCSCASQSCERAQQRIDRGDVYCIKMKATRDSTSVNDAVYGYVTFPPRDGGSDDAVLLKQDGWPTYHLANVVDDHLMAITHVLRGWEWLSSTPLHSSLYAAFGWTPPVFAHVPLLINADGSKLSKRKGDAFVDQFRSKGYLPSALLNYIGFLGWTPSVELASSILPHPIDAMTPHFSLEKIQRNAAQTDAMRLNHVNKEHLKDAFHGALIDTPVSALSPLAHLCIVQLRETVSAQLDPPALLLDDTFLARALVILHRRVSCVPDIPTLAPYFWRNPSPADYASVAAWCTTLSSRLESLSAPPLSTLLHCASTYLQASLASASVTRSSGSAPSLLIAHLVRTHTLPRDLAMQIVRMAVTASRVGGSLPDTLNLIGTPSLLARLDCARDSLVH